MNAEDENVILSTADRKFGRKKYLVSDAPVRYPESVEREYLRVVDNYVKLASTVMRKYLPEIKKAAAVEYSSEIRIDEVKDFQQVMQEAFEKMYSELHDRMTFYDLLQRIQKVANREKKLSIREWNEVLEKTLGVNVMDDYYNGRYFIEAIERWVQDNANLIKTIPENTLGDLQSIVKDGFRLGKSGRDITKELQKTYDLSRSRARFIATDQVSKLNAEITRKQQEDAGATKYQWHTSRDSRVRDRHRELEGRTFSWDDPPVVDFKTGRRCHPGEDYRCRCRARAIFDEDAVAEAYASQKQPAMWKFPYTADKSKRIEQMRSVGVLPKSRTKGGG